MDAILCQRPRVTIFEANEGKRRTGGRAVKHGLVSMVLGADKEEQKIATVREAENPEQPTDKLIEKSGINRGLRRKRELKQLKSRSSDARPGEGLSSKDEKRGSLSHLSHRSRSMDSDSGDASSDTPTVEGVGEVGPGITQLRQLGEVPVDGIQRVWQNLMNESKRKAQKSKETMSAKHSAVSTRLDQLSIKELLSRSGHGDSVHLRRPAESM